MLPHGRSWLSRSSGSFAKCLSTGCKRWATRNSISFDILVGGVDQVATWGSVLPTSLLRTARSRQGAWIRFVQKLNANKLGNAVDLGTFLFGQERANLKLPLIMMDIQRGECLYCRKPLPKQSQVDHFVPWSRYPMVTWATTLCWPTEAAITPECRPFSGGRCFWLLGANGTS